MELFQGQFSVLAYFPRFACNCVDDILYATLNHFRFWKANSGNTLYVAWDEIGWDWVRESTNGEAAFHHGGSPQWEELSQALLLTSSQAKNRSGNQRSKIWAKVQHQKPASTSELCTAIILCPFLSNQGIKSEFQKIYSISDYQTEEFDNRAFLNAKQWVKISFK